MQPYIEVFSLAIVGDDLFAATVNRTVYRSTNDGMSWTDVGEAMGGIGFLTNLAAGERISLWAEAASSVPPIAA